MTVNSLFNRLVKNRKHVWSKTYGMWNV